MQGLAHTPALSSTPQERKFVRHMPLFKLAGGDLFNSCADGISARAVLAKGRGQSSPSNGKIWQRESFGYAFGNVAAVAVCATIGRSNPAMKRYGVKIMHGEKT